MIRIMTVPVSGKDIMQGKICIEGNTQIDDFFSKDEEFIRETVKQACSDAAAGGGFVLCPTASPFPPVLEEKTLNNYLVYIEAGLEYGN